MTDNKKKLPKQSFKEITAEIFSWAFFPPLVATVFFIFLIFWYSNDLSQGLKWLVMIAPFLIFIPLVFFALSYKFGWVSDIDLSERQERPVFLLVFISSLAIASAILLMLRVPEQIFVYAFSGLVMTVVASAITIYWKISFHTAVVTSVITAVVILGGWWFAPFFLFVPVVGWSRIVLGKHSFWQVTSGALLAFVITLVIFYLFGYNIF